MEYGYYILLALLFGTMKVANSPWVLLVVLVPFLFGRVRHLARLGKWGLAAIHLIIALLILLLPGLIIVLLYHTAAQRIPIEFIGIAALDPTRVLPEVVHFSPKPAYFWHIWYWALVRQPSLFWLVTGILLFVGQIFYWIKLWVSYRKNVTGTSWRCAAPVACVWSIIMVLLLSGIVIPALDESREAVHNYQRHLKSFQGTVRRVKLNDIIYPRSYGSFLESFRRPGFGYGEMAGFLTWDSPERIFAFYEKLANDAGMQVRRGTRPSGDGTAKQLPVLVAKGKISTLEVSPYLNQRNMWRITVCEPGGPSFDRYEKWGYRLSD